MTKIVINNILEIKLLKDYIATIDPLHIDLKKEVKNSD